MTKYAKLREFLKNFKTLTGDEADIFISILEKGKKVTANDVSAILTKQHKTSTASRAYTILNNLVAKDVLFPDTSHPAVKTFRAVHPRELLNQVKSELETLDQEVALIEQSREVAEDDLDITGRTLRGVSEIRSWIAEMVDQGYSLSLSFDGVSFKEGDMLIQRLCTPNQVPSSRGDVTALFATQRGKPEAVAIITPQTDLKGGVVKPIANVVYNAQLFALLQNEVKNDKRRK